MTERSNIGLTGREYDEEGRNVPIANNNHADSHDILAESGGIFVLTCDSGNLRLTDNVLQRPTRGKIRHATGFALCKVRQPSP